MESESDPAIILHADKTVDIEHIVKVIYCLQKQIQNSFSNIIKIKMKLPKKRQA